MQFISRAFCFHLYKSKRAKHFSRQRKFLLPLFLSPPLSLVLYPPVEHISRNDSVYTERREKSFNENHPLSFFFLQSFVSVDATSYLEIYLSAAETDLQVGVYTTLYLPTRYKKFYALYMRIALYTQNFYVTKTKDEGLRPRVSLWEFVLPFEFLFASFFISQVMINITDLSPL